MFFNKREMIFAFSKKFLGKPFLLRMKAVDQNRDAILNPLTGV